MVFYDKKCNFYYICILYNCSNSNPDSSFSYANNALELLKQLKDSIRNVKTELQTHRKNIFRKTNANSVNGLIKYAYEHRLI